jgi:NADH-quinone oxidoreductase subunit F
MSKLHTRDDLIALRKACKNALALEKRRIFVCGGTGCVAGGSIGIYNRLKELMEERGLPVDVDLVEEVHHD